MNIVSLVGYIAEPKIKVIGETNKVANFSLATKERAKVDGEWQDATEWHNIVVFGRQVEFIEKHVSKGAMVSICGRIRSRSWESGGETKYITEVITRDFSLLKGGTNGQKVETTEAVEGDGDDLPF